MTIVIENNKIRMIGNIQHIKLSKRNLIYDGAGKFRL